MAEPIDGVDPSAAADDEPTWVFAYGSLIFRIDFPYLQRKRACIEGWQRRFWQGSHDHRGTPEAPGRVVTLIAAPGARCAGMAYQVAPQVFAHLDYREKNGYERHPVTLTLEDDECVAGLVYIAPVDNFAYLGPAPDEVMARQIAMAVGPSGANSDYLRELAAALRALDIHDPHVFTLERLLPDH